MGAIAPSSPGLARAMAAQLDPASSGDVVELGPGTGIVTEAILARGIAPERLTAIEFDADFARELRARFPLIRVVQGDAFDLAASLGREPTAPLAAIVSSLPLLNQPVERRDTLLQEMFARLTPGAPFVQFSYGAGAPVPAPQGTRVARAAFILANLPPASVWVYRRV